MKDITPEALIYEFLAGERYPDSGTTVVLNVEQLYGRLQDLCLACGIKEQDARKLLEEMHKNKEGHKAGCHCAKCRVDYIKRMVPDGETKAERLYRQSQ